MVSPRVTAEPRTKAKKAYEKPAIVYQEPIDPADFFTCPMAMGSGDTPHRRLLKRRKKVLVAG